MINTIILNSPPGSGKDTIANMLVNQCNATKHEFKTALYVATAEYYKVDLNYFKNLATDRDQKDSLNNSFGTMFEITPRNALIHVSEDIIKPKHGLSYFGDISAESLTEGLNVFSDGGFVGELKPISNKSDKLLVVKLYRNGFNFNNDSRNYIREYTDSSKVKFYNIKLKENDPQKAVDSIKSFLITENITTGI